MAFLIDILMHTGFFIITIPVFYFEFVAHLVNHSLAEQISSIIKIQLLKLQLNKYLNKSNVQQIYNEFNSIFSEKIEETQEKLTYKNSLIYTQAYTICGSIAAGCIFLAFILSLVYGENFMELMYSNLIVILFILFSEFIIVYFFLDSIKLIDFQFLRAIFLGAVSGYNTTIVCDFVGVFMRIILPQELINLV